MKKTILLVSLSVAFIYWGACRFAPAAGNVAADERLYVVTHVDVMPKFTDAARDLLKQFAADSRKDAGAVRIEVLEELGRSNHSTVVEIWASRQAYEDHLAADHTKAYRAKLQPMLGSPFDERLHRLSSTDADR
jgi:quinol monooxygenase YgiN